MTTIACDGKSIAADGMISGNGVIHDLNNVKVFRLNSGGIVGVSGSAYYCAAALAYLNGEADSLDVGDEFEAIILHPNGECECMDGKGRSYPQTVPTATGSGTPFALAVMDMGFDAKEAIEAAAKRDCYTGGLIKVLDLEA
jgi:hypothetical protein